MILLFGLGSILGYVSHFRNVLSGVRICGCSDIILIDSAEREFTDALDRSGELDSTLAVKCGAIGKREVTDGLESFGSGKCGKLFAVVERENADRAYAFGKSNSFKS